jgi:hypothetical protein
LAYLRGARLVAAAETERGRQWNETKLTQLTGGDRIPARFVYGNFFEFTPSFTPSFIGNHKPKLHNVGEATRRRFNLVPFLLKHRTSIRIWARSCGRNILVSCAGSSTAVSTGSKTACGRMLY